MNNKNIIKFLIIVSFLFNGGQIMALQLISDAFKNNEYIPKEYTCDDKNISPQLSWQTVPTGTQSFVLIVDDPDAPNGTWFHWILYNIPAGVHELEKNIQKLPFETEVGKNSWSNTNYGGPCPPSGTHRYYFKLYALDTKLAFENVPNYNVIIAAMNGHILDQAILIGRYQRQ